MLRPAEKWCHPTKQGEKDKSRVPAVFQQAGLHGAPMPFMPDASTQLPAGAGGILPFGQAQSQKDRGEQEEGRRMSEEHPCLSHNLQWAISHDLHQIS